MMAASSAASPSPSFAGAARSGSIRSVQALSESARPTMRPRPGMEGTMGSVQPEAQGANTPNNAGTAGIGGMTVGPTDGLVVAPQLKRHGGVITHERRAKRPRNSVPIDPNIHDIVDFTISDNELESDDEIIFMDSLPSVTSRTNTAATTPIRPTAGSRLLESGRSGSAVEDLLGEEVTIVGNEGLASVTQRPSATWSSSATPIQNMAAQQTPFLRDVPATTRPRLATTTQSPNTAAMQTLTRPQSAVNPPSSDSIIRDSPAYVPVTRSLPAATPGVSFSQPAWVSATPADPIRNSNSAPRTFLKSRPSVNPASFTSITVNSFSQSVSSSTAPQVHQSSAMPIPARTPDQFTQPSVGVTQVPSPVPSSINQPLPVPQQYSQVATARHTTMPAQLIRPAPTSVPISIARVNVSVVSQPQPLAKNANPASPSIPTQTVHTATLVAPSLPVNGSAAPIRSNATQRPAPPFGTDPSSRPSTGYSATTASAPGPILPSVPPASNVTPRLAQPLSQAESRASAVSAIVTPKSATTTAAPTAAPPLPATSAQIAPNVHKTSPINPPQRMRENTLSAKAVSTTSVSSMSTSSQAAISTARTAPSPSPASANIILNTITAPAQTSTASGQKLQRVRATVSANPVVRPAAERLASTSITTGSTTTQHLIGPSFRPSSSAALSSQMQPPPTLSHSTATSDSQAIGQRSSPTKSPVKSTAVLPSTSTGTPTNTKTNSAPVASAAVLTSTQTGSAQIVRPTTIQSGSALVVKSGNKAPRARDTQTAPRASVPRHTASIAHWRSDAIPRPTGLRPPQPVPVPSPDTVRPAEIHKSSSANITQSAKSSPSRPTATPNRSDTPRSAIVAPATSITTDSTVAKRVDKVIWSGAAEKHSDKSAGSPFAVAPARLPAPGGRRSSVTAAAGDISKASPTGGAESPSTKVTSGASPTKLRPNSAPAGVSTSALPSKARGGEVVGSPPQTIGSDDSTLAAAGSTGSEVPQMAKSAAATPHSGSSTSQPLTNDKKIMTEETVPTFRLRAQAARVPPPNALQRNTVPPSSALPVTVSPLNTVSKGTIDTISTTSLTSNPLAQVPNTLHQVKSQQTVLPSPATPASGSVTPTRTPVVAPSLSLPVAAQPAESSRGTPSVSSQQPIASSSSSSRISQTPTSARLDKGKGKAKALPSTKSSHGESSGTTVEAAPFQRPFWGQNQAAPELKMTADFALSRDMPVSDQHKPWSPQNTHRSPEHDVPVRPLAESRLFLRRNIKLGMSGLAEELYGQSRRRVRRDVKARGWEREGLTGMDGYLRIRKEQEANINTSRTQNVLRIVPQLVEILSGGDKLHKSSGKPYMANLCATWDGQDPMMALPFISDVHYEDQIKLAPLRAPVFELGIPLNLTILMGCILDRNVQPWPNKNGPPVSRWETEGPICVVTADGKMSERIDMSKMGFRNEDVPGVELAFIDHLEWTRPEKARLQPIKRNLIRPRTVSDVRVRYTREAKGEDVEVDWPAVRKGWKCELCSDLGDLGGEAELAAHFAVLHHEECWVDSIWRMNDDIDGERLFLQIHDSKGMAEGFDVVGDLGDAGAGGVLIVDPDTRRGVAKSIMKGRKSNQWTEWSHRVIPGTLADLIPELDKLWDGGRFRHVMREVEETHLWDRHEIPETRRFVMTCWNRWRDESGPMRWNLRTKWIRGFIDKYGPMLRRIDAETEFQRHMDIMLARGNDIDVISDALVYWYDAGEAAEKAGVDDSMEIDERVT